MINYSDELKKLRFNFNPEEIIDYQALITLAGSIIVGDNYEEYSAELFQTIQILVLIYGLDEQVESTKFAFSYDNININDLNLYKYLVYILYNDLVKSSEFKITDDTKNKIYVVLNLLDNGIKVEDNIKTEPNTCEEPVVCDNDLSTGMIIDNEPYEFVDPKGNFSFAQNEEPTKQESTTYKEPENLNSFNWNYLRDYIIQNNLLPYACSECGISSWQNKPISLILNKKDKYSSDQNLYNLKFLCPNCNSQLGN